MSVSLEWFQAECSREAISATSSSRRPSISFVLLLICNSYSTSVQPSVSIPIADRPSGGAQVRSLCCREWRVANVLHWVGRLMFNSDGRALFLPASHPAVHSSGHSRQHPGQMWGSVALGWGPSLSLTCLGEKSNLLYEATRHDGANVHWEVNGMEILMSVSTTIWETCQ